MEYPKETNGTTSLKAERGFLGNYYQLKRQNPGFAKVFAFVSVAVYLSLFLVTGWLISSLTGFPWIASTGLVFLARLCLT